MKRHTKNNKGFSLVELIVVIAIMAVLVVVLAPTYLRYVEKSKVNKDVAAVSEVVSAFKLAGASYDIDGLKVTISNTGAVTVEKASATGTNTNASSVQTEVQTSVGTTIPISCKDLTKAGASVTITASGNTITVATTGVTDDANNASDAYTQINALK